MYTYNDYLSHLCSYAMFLRINWTRHTRSIYSSYTPHSLEMKKTDLAIPILNGHYVNHQAKEKLPNLCPLCWHAACAQWRRAVGSSGRLVTTGSQCVFGATRSNGDQRTWVPAYRRVRNLWPNLCPDAEAFVRH
jgi:hypothetical protein